MQNIPSLVVSAVSTWDGKALGKGQKQIGGFEKGVKSLAKTLGATFGAAAMLSYGKNAVKAFAENEKSAKRLEMVLKNIGLGFDTAAIEKNLADISAKFGYEGEVLRESFQKLVTVTGDTAKAQDLLNLSLDVAAGSGESLATVNADLAAAVVGNTKGLRKYNLGLTQTELKTLDLNDAVKLLSRTFGGAGEAELKTFSGQMRVLREAAGDAQETIGEGLVDAFGILAGEQGIGKATDAMDKFSESIKYALIGMAELVSFETPTGTKSLFGLLLTPILRSLEAGPLGALIRLGERTSIKPKPFTTPMTVSGSTDAQGKIERDRAKAAAEAAKREKERLALAKKQLLAEKNKLSLSKAAAVFDTNRISIAAALRATYDKETILRLEALQAIEDDNGELALKKINELAALQKNADMAKLAGVTQIKEATLAAINTQLLTELKAINDSKMAETDKETARQIAFGKYNAAITAAGDLAAKESYSERVQIQLTEIARLASLSKTTNAANTAALLRESAELSMIDRVAKAQKAADDARLKALQEYAAALGKIGTGGVTDGGAKGGTFGGKSADQLAQDAALKKFFDEQIAKLTADAKAADEALKAQLEKVTLDTILKAETDAVIELLEATAARADAFTLLTDDATKAVADYLAGDPFKNGSGLIDTEMLAQTSFLAGLSGGAGVAGAASGARYAAQAARYYNISINAGAIASQDEFTTLLQDTIQKINRDGDPLFVAGTI